MFKKSRRAETKLYQYFKNICTNHSMIEIHSVTNILSNHGGSLKSKIHIVYPNLLLPFIMYTEYTT